MGKHSKTDSSSPLKDKYNHKSGWLSGMLHVLDFPRWRAKNRPTCWKTPRTHSLVHETEEQEQPFLDSQDSKILSVVPEKDPKKRELRKTMTTKQVTEYVDILEILRKEDVVVKIMKDPDSEFGKKVQIKSNPRFLPKSGSFPLPGSSRPARIEHKQKENWYAPKQNGAVLTLNVPRERDTSHQENKPTLPSHDGSSDDHGFNHTVVNGFREIKKLLKKAIKDRKHTKKSKKYSSVSKDHDDPMGRYSRLLEQSFERKSGELRSKSLRLSYEEKNIDSRDDNKPIFFRRVSSLSSLEVLGSFLTELPRDSTIKKSLDQDSTNFGSKKPSLLPETPAKTEKQEEEEERDEEKEEISQENRIDTPIQRILEQDSDNTAQKTEDLTSQGLCLQEEEHEDTCFCYVKKVLKLSGLLENKYTEKWYSEEQPLNPSLLYQLEIQEEVNKEILFDLINEAIVETHNKSEIYFSYKNEKRFLDQVWRRVEWSLYGLGAENKDCSLDDIVGKDLKRGDDQWMNLRSESQCLILELEDLIFDDVLHELLSVYY